MRYMCPPYNCVFSGISAAKISQKIKYTSLYKIENIFKPWSENFGVAKSNQIFDEVHIFL